MTLKRWITHVVHNTLPVFLPEVSCNGKAQCANHLTVSLEDLTGIVMLYLHLPEIPLRIQNFTLRTFFQMYVNWIKRAAFYSQSGGLKLLQACLWKHFSYVVNFWLQFVPGYSKWMFWLLVTGTKAHIWERNDLSTNSLWYYRAIEKDPPLMKNKQRSLYCFRWSVIWYTLYKFCWLI